MTTENERRILAEVRARLSPPTDREFDEVAARWLFGKNGPKMLAHAPWSFLLLKLMWKKGEEPWAS
jgi:hypothetical protein